MPNERYVKISMRDRWEKIPYDSNGDPAFTALSPEGYIMSDVPYITELFNHEEIVNLVNKALYVMKYQRETHANRRKAKKEETS